MTLRVEGLVVAFEGVPALRGIDLSFEPDRVHAIIGPPAAGKSVLLKAIAGLVQPASGSVSFRDRSLSASQPAGFEDWQRAVGMAFQNDALFDALTVYENVAFPLRRRGLDDAEVAERVETMLGRVELTEAAERFPAEISGGMRKRCGIARAAVTEPAIGLYDDPTAGLDPETSDSILELVVSSARGAGSVCVIVSNELPSLLARADQVAVLHDGALRFVGTPEALSRSDDPVVYQFIRGDIDGPL